MLTGMVVGVDGLMCVIDELSSAGYDVWAPAIRDGVVTARRFQAGDELPVGFASDQSPGAYELVDTADRSRFGWAVGPQPWKPLLHPASVVTMKLAQADATSTVAVSVRSRPRRPLALFGLRPCDLAGIDKLDSVLLDQPSSAEPTYQALRSDALLVVVNCGVPASTCFCASVDTGPHVGGRTAIHDLEVTELVADKPTDEPEYVIEAVSDRGADFVDRITRQVDGGIVTDVVRDRIESNRTDAEAMLRRNLPHRRIGGVLAQAHSSPRWDEMADTCLACGNCTAVCPTCFCTTIHDVGDLTGRRVERRRDWESCFSLEFSRLGGASVRTSVGARYRQWMTHKLGTWHDQFGESGCVGCGRCTTWCPVGIDFVELATTFVHDAASGEE